MRWPTIFLGLLALVSGGKPGLAQQEMAGVNSSDVRLEVVVEAPAGEPIEQEMMLLSVRGAYDARLNVALDTLAQPRLQHFSWMQLGRDRWARGLIDGRQVRTFERRLAVFPQRSGTLEIGSFKHQLTIASGDGGRVQHEVRSTPVTVRVQAKIVAAGWWLPARDMRITDEWDRAPDRLVPGDLAHRTVTLDAIGVTPQFLPPAPEMKGAGLIVFNDPEERSIQVTRGGPVSRVRWRWTVRPTSSESAELRPVTITWFDTGARQVREHQLAAQKIGFAAQAARSSVGSAFLPSEGANHIAPAGWAVGLVCGLVVLLSGRRLKPASELRQCLRRLRPCSELKELRCATRRGDLLAVRQAATQWVKRLEGDGRAPNPAVVALLRDLDRQLFARGRETDRWMSRGLARELLRTARQQS